MRAGRFSGQESETCAALPPEMDVSLKRDPPRWTTIKNMRTAATHMPAIAGVHRGGGAEAGGDGSSRGAHTGVPV